MRLRDLHKKSTYAGAINWYIIVEDGDALDQGPVTNYRQEMPGLINHAQDLLGMDRGYTITSETDGIYVTWLETGFLMLGDRDTLQQYA